MTAARSSLVTYSFRRLLMLTPLAEQTAHALVRERQLTAEAAVG